MKNKFDFFIGPCVLEDLEMAKQTAEYLKDVQETHQDQINLYFKASFDKANRSSIDSYRGPGLEKGLRMLEIIKREFELPIITDFHLPEQASDVAEVVDVLQIPAFLCRQTDMIVAGAEACAREQIKLKIKKGQFLSPEDTKQIVLKAKTKMPLEDIYLTERGSSFGYNRLIVDMTSFKIMKEFGVKVIHDATHCVQRPGGLGDRSGGAREFIDVLAKAAIAAGADGVFMEAHPRPNEAKSDAATQMSLDQVGVFVAKCIVLAETVRGL
jgi:2-dehydro-3-deoxyphosphooctonate aldolase (KDO 8-P synthase)